MPSLTGQHIRQTNRNLWRSMMTFAVIFVALGLNFLLTVPTFEQFGIPKNVIGWSFMVLGVTKLITLNFVQSIEATRVILMLSVVFMVFWGIGTTQTAFAGESSFQLCVLYWGLSALQIPLLLEPFYSTRTGDPREAQGVKRGDDDPLVVDRDD